MRRLAQPAPVPHGALERILRRVAPGYALRRAEQRRLLQELDRAAARDFEAASSGRRTKGWRADSTDPNAEIGDALEVLRNRHRQLVRDDPWASRAVRVVVNHGVGTGIAARSLAAARRAKRLDDRWREFSSSVECDQHGRLTVDGMTRAAFRSVVEGGDCLVRRIWSSDRNGPGGVPFRLQALEGDHLATGLSREADPEVNRGGHILQGVEFNAEGRRVAYHLHRTHPGAPWPARREETIRVPARDVLHPYRLDRLGQVRGVPWGAAAMLRMRDWALYEDAQLLRQRIAACFVAFEHDLNGEVSADATAKPLPSYTKGGAADGADLQHLEPGTWEKLGGGRTITFGTPPGVEGYRENFEISAMAVAVAYGLTYAQLTGDLSSANYSSMRGGAVEQRSEVDDWRWHLIIPHMSNPLWGWFVEGLLVAGEVAEARDLRLVDFTPPRHELLDPTKEIPAMRDEIRSGLISWQEALRTRGYDHRTVADQIAADAQLLDQLGIALDSDGRRPVNGTGAAPAAAGQGGDQGAAEGSDGADGQADDAVEETDEAEAERAHRLLDRVRAG